MSKIGKIVELLIDWENMEFEDLGTSIMSLVDKPAIGISWQAFSEYENIEMIDGIVELLNQVDDIENRKEMAKSSMDAFIEDEIAYDQDDFLRRIGLHLMPDGELMEGTEHDMDLEDACWPGWEAIGMKTKNGKQVPNCVPIQNSKQSEEEVDPIILMASQPDFGEVLDYANTIEISESQANFSDFTDTLQGIIGLDILGKKDPTDEGEIKFRYSGPSAQRDFCRAMLSLNKVYTRDELQRLNSFNPGFGKNGAPTYNVFKYKGGPNCTHFWEQVRVFKEGRRTVVVSEGPSTVYNGLAGEPPADMRNNGYALSEWKFSDDDQMIITGPAMTPNVMIPRKDGDGNPFHVYFTEDTIEKISRKFMYDSNQNNTDINHDDNLTTENVLLESWIVDDPEMDKSKKFGFNVPKGTWMVSYKINNEETWDKIKNKELNGFSITGQFIERAVK